VGQLNGRYAPPELIAGDVHPTADQYSLAVLLQEMLTGTSPFRGSPSRGKARPNLDLLPAPDRAAVARALSPDPEKRFTTCKELIEGLDRGGRGGHTRARAAVLLPPVIAAPSAGSPPTGPLPAAAEVIGALFNHAAGRLEVHQSDALFYAVHPGNLLRHSCGARLSPALARLKLEGFCLHWNAETVHEDGGAFILQVPLAGSFWQRCFGKEPALEVHLLLVPPPAADAGLTEVCVEIHPVRCRPDRAAALLTQQAPQLLNSLRTFLNVEPERRLGSRVPFSHPLGTFPVFGDGELGDPVVCHGKDVSVSGIGLYCAEPPASQRLYVQSLLAPELTRVALLGKVVRTRRCDDGRHEVGVLFLQEPESWLPPDV
jgi:serine/threonine protein kinase